MDQPQQLAGRRVLVTAHRRSDDLVDALERRGAEVIPAAVLSIRDGVDDEALLASTRALVADPPDVVVVTTGVGLRGWLAAADAAGLGPELLAVLRGARLVARGAKARGAVQGAGLTAAFVAASETSAEVVEHLLSQGVDGLHVAVQHHGAGSADVDEPLRAAGARVTPLVVYAWASAPDPQAVHEGLRQVADRAVDAVVFTSAPGVLAFLEAAREQGLYDEVVDAMRAGAVLAATVGPVTSAPLEALGIPALVPARHRLGAMITQLVTALARPTLLLVSHGTRDEQGRAVVSALAGQVARQAGARVVEAFVDVQEPRVVDAVAAAGECVVVPVLLSAGMHHHWDVEHAVDVRVAAPLGAGAALAPVVLAQAEASGARALVVVAAGSRRPEATADVEHLAEVVAQGWSGGPVRVAYGAAAEPTLSAALAALRSEGYADTELLVVPYLLAPGFFLDRVREQAGPVRVAEPLGRHPGVVDVVVARYEQALAEPIR